MAEKLFNEYYTKKFDLPGRFTALNGAIQYFEVTVSAPLADGSKAAQANYLRTLEILRSRGAQPIITSVEDVEGKGKVCFTLEQTWVYGERGNMQVSAKYEPSFTQDDAFNGLKVKAVKDIEEAFGDIKALVENADGELEDTGAKLYVGADIKTTAGSLNANA